MRRELGNLHAVGQRGEVADAQELQHLSKDFGMLLGTFSFRSRQLRRMNAFATVILALVLVPVTLSPAAAAGPASAPATQPATAPADWQNVNVADRFQLRLPPDMKEQKVQGIDSLVSRFGSDQITLSSDYVWYSDPLKYDDKKGYQRKAMVIGGKEALIVTFQDHREGEPMPFVTGVHFPSVTGDGKVRLTVYATCRDEKAQQTARRIFETITFPKRP